MAIVRAIIALVTPELVQRLAAFFQADPHGAIAVYLFGSTARGDDRPTSDVDLGVLFDTVPASSLAGVPLTLGGEVECLLGRAVDLVVLNTAPADLVHRVLRDGKLVLDRDPPARLRFEVSRRNEFFDLAPVRERYRRMAASRDRS